MLYFIAQNSIDFKTCVGPLTLQNGGKIWLGFPVSTLHSLKKVMYDFSV